MKDGFISVACGTPKLRLADCHYNAEQTFTMMRDADKRGVKVLVLPELGLTGYSCGDLFYQNALLRGAEEALATVLEATRPLEVLTAVGIMRTVWGCVTWVDWLLTDVRLRIRGLRGNVWRWRRWCSC